jgi:hypothetical protein
MATPALGAARLIRAFHDLKPLDTVTRVIAVKNRRVTPCRAFTHPGVTEGDPRNKA